MSRAVNRILIFLFLLVFLISTGMITHYYMESREVSKKYSELSSQVHQLSDTKENSDGILSQYEDLLSLNPDSVGWIQIEGTVIDYPVVQTSNNDYYLHREFDKSENSHGCIFMDTRCNTQKETDNLILYGHHMKDGTMFAMLDQYKKESFWKDHPVILFDTLEEHGEYEVMAVFAESVDSGNKDEFPYYDYIDLSETERYLSFVNQCLKHSIYSTGITAAPGDRLLTLSTCEYSKQNGRMVVVARKR